MVIASAHTLAFQVKLIFLIGNSCEVVSLLEIAAFLLFLEVVVEDKTDDVVLGNACADKEDENFSSIDPSALKYV